MHDGSNVEMSNVERLNVGGSWEDEEEEEQARIVQLYIRYLRYSATGISLPQPWERRRVVVPLSELSKLSSLPRRHLLVGSNFNCQHFGQS